MTKWNNPSGTREYYAWRSMRSRCSSPKNAAWVNYGGRGIFVCDEWVESYDAFFNDMGKCPEGFSLDRIDNDKGYSKDNCRWADIATQLNNRRANVFIEYNGETKTISQWARKFNLKVDTLHKRLSRMSVSRAFTSENLIEKYATPMEHGTRKGYERHGCRCELCRKSNAKRHKDYMDKKRKVSE